MGKHANQRAAKNSRPRAISTRASLGPLAPPFGVPGALTELLRTLGLRASQCYVQCHMLVKAESASEPWGRTTKPSRALEMIHRNNPHLSERVGICFFRDKMMDVMTSQGQFQPPNSILLIPTTAATERSQAQACD